MNFIMYLGSDLVPPPLPPPSIIVWRAILAGGIAGLVSRTATAPIEKIKILAQVP
jgi:solute carrier family 25 phosphate transporter 23/24/25/41